jgi:hypothetical protein
MPESVLDNLLSAFVVRDHDFYVFGVWTNEQEATDQKDRLTDQHPEKVFGVTEFTINQEID